MKRFVVTLSAIAMMVTFAVQAEAGAMYGGIKGGANFGDLSELDNTSMRTGFQGGLYVGKDISPEFGFRVEGLWVQKGASADIDYGSAFGGVHNTKFKLDYIEFPILFVYNLSNSETMGFNVFAGPTLGFNVGADVEVETFGSTDVKDETNSFEFGAAIGAGIAKKMANGKAIGLDARYTLGATGTNKDVGAGEIDPKNRGIGLMAFFQIPLGSSAQ